MKEEPVQVAMTSARNKLPGVITAVKRGDVMCQVDMQVGDNHVVAVITTEAADEMGLAVGMEAIATFKSTLVMITTQRKRRQRSLTRFVRQCSGHCWRGRVILHVILQLP